MSFFAPKKNRSKMYFLMFPTSYRKILNAKWSFLWQNCHPPLSSFCYLIENILDYKKTNGNHQECQVSHWRIERFQFKTIILMKKFLLKQKQFPLYRRSLKIACLEVYGRSSINQWSMVWNLLPKFLSCMVQTSILIFREFRIHWSFYPKKTGTTSRTPCTVLSASSRKNSKR